MNTKYTFIIVLLLTITGCVGLLSQNDNFITTDLSINSKQSKNLIDRFNTLRAMDNLESIKHDTVLDNICKILLTDNRNNCNLALKEYFPQSYRKSAGVYDEDSVRLLFRASGIVDYQYEIQEVSDKDTADVFNSFFLADKWNHIRAGYYRNGNRNLLLKTESYLKCTHVRVETKSYPNDDSFQPSAIKCYTESCIHYFKILNPDQYYYQFYEKIPSSNEKGDNSKQEEVQITPGTSEYYGEYDISIKSVGQETDMFVVITDKNNQRVAVIK